MKNVLLPRFVSLFIMAGLQPLLYAQSTPAAGAEASDEALRLSPFLVATDKDDSYKASTSITATGIGTKIADIPANINVITQDFMNDQNMNELRFTVNSVSSVDTDSRALDRLTINVRGLPATIQQGGYDGAFLSLENVDRIEIIKGPSAVFNGNVVPGGMVNVIKSEPDFKPSTTISALYGSYDDFLGKLRQTGPIIPDVLAYNIFASYLDKGDRDQYTYDREKFVSGGLRLVLGKKFTSLFDFEIENEVYEGVPEEQAGSNKAFIAAVNAGTVPYLQTSRTWLNNNPAYGPNALNLNEFVTNIYYPYPGFNPLGPDSPSSLEGYNLRSETTVLVTDALSVILRLNYDDSRTTAIDFNTFRPVAGQLPGQLLVNSNFQETNGESKTLDSKLEVAYKLSLFKVNQNILIGAQDEINKAYQRTLSGPLIVWNPRTQPALDGQAQIASGYPNGLPLLPPFATSIARAYYVADQVSAFSDTLHLLLGARDSQLSNATGLAQSKVTPEFGLLYRPIKYVAAYANYSETFLPNYILDAYGNQLGPTTGKGHDFGAKFDFFGGRLTATAGVYKEDYANIPVRNSPLEAQLHIAPLYILSGLEQTAGFESDLNFSPTKNYQVVASFDDSWEHRTVVSTTPQQDNVPLANVPHDEFNLWNKYTFTDGITKGVFVGVGAKYESQTRLHPNYDVGLYGGGFTVWNALLGYRGKLRNYAFSVQYNVNNVFNKVYFDGVYQLGEPITHTVTVKFTF